MTALSGNRGPAYSCLPRERKSRVFGAAFLVALILCGLPAAASAQDQERLYSLYQKASAAQQKGDLSSAAALYEEIVRLSPDLAEAHANLGSIYYELRDDAKALDSLDQAIRLKPELAAPHFFSGVISSRGRNYTAAIGRLETAAKLDPSNLVVQVYLGAAYFARGKFPQAARAFEAATTLPEFRADAYYHLSKAYGEISKDLLTKLARKNPDSYYFHLARAHFQESRRNWQEAADAYQAAVAVKPDAEDLEARRRWVNEQLTGGAAASRPALSQNAATLLGYLYDPPPDVAVEKLLSEKMKQLVQSPSDAMEDAALYRSAEDHQIASYLAARWISANDPGSYRGHQLRAQLHESRGETEEAIREYGQAIALKPDLQNVHFAVGSLYWAARRFDEALAELQAELEINPNHPDAHYEIADILREAGRDAEAKVHLLECIRIEPQMLDAHLAIERIYFAEGEFDKALAQIQEAARIAPSDPTPQYRMSAIYRKLGKLEEARAALERFRELKAR